MRTLKKTLCLVLALVMCLGMFTVASADNGVDNLSKFTDAKDVNYPEAVDFLVAAGVVHGDTANRLNPQGNITRAEAATLVAYMLLGKEAADAYKATEYPFTDVKADHWAAGYIQFAEKEDYIEGMGDGTFRPNDNIRGIDMASLLLRVLGYGRGGAPALSYPAGVQAKALSLGMFDEVTSAASMATINREKVFQMVFNTMVNIATVQYNASSKLYFTGTDNFDGHQNFCVGDEGADWWEVDSKLEAQNGYKNTLGYKTANLVPYTDGNNDALGYAMREWKNRKTGNAVTNEYDFYTLVETVTAKTNLKALTKKIEAASGNECEIWINGGSITNGVASETGKSDDPAKVAGLAVKAAQDGYTVELIDTNDNGLADRLIIVIEYIAQVDKVTPAKGDKAAEADINVYQNKEPKKIEDISADDFAIVNTLKKDEIVTVIPQITATSGTDYVLNADPKDAKVPVAVKTNADPISIETITPVASAVTSFQGTLNNDSPAVNTQSVTFGGTTYNYSGVAPVDADTNEVFTARNGYKLNGSIYDFYFNEAGYIIGVIAQKTAPTVPNYIYVTKFQGNYNPEDLFFDTSAAIKAEGYLVDGTKTVYNIEVKENSGKTALKWESNKVKLSNDEEASAVNNVDGVNLLEEGGGNDGTDPVIESASALASSVKYYFTIGDVVYVVGRGIYTDLQDAVYKYTSKDGLVTLDDDTLQPVGNLVYDAGIVGNNEKLVFKPGDAIVVTDVSDGNGVKSGKLYATTSTNLVLVGKDGPETETGYANFPDKEYKVGTAGVTGAFFVTTGRNQSDAQKDDTIVVTDIVVIGGTGGAPADPEVLFAYTGNWQEAANPENETNVDRYEFVNGATGEKDYYPVSDGTKALIKALTADKIPTAEAVFYGTLKGPNKEFDGAAIDALKGIPGGADNATGKTGAGTGTVVQDANNWFRIDDNMLYQGELVAYDLTDGYDQVDVKDNDTIVFACKEKQGGGFDLTAVFVVPAGA